MELDNAAIQQLQAGIKGEVLSPNSAEYESARQIWNAMIDKHPALIIRCTSTADVVKAVNFGRESGLEVSVRSGGHNIAGTALVENGIVIDLSKMKTASVDVDARTVTIQAGATLGDLDAATQAHGLATPVGINSTTGIAGLTLGGGFGWLSRKYGMTVDNVDAIEVVTAAGDIVHASATDHPDLFWALRGGSGNFGVATSFTYRLHAVGPNLLTGLVVYPIAEAKSVLQQYNEFMKGASDEMSVWSVLRLAPPLPFLPEAVHGTPVVVLAICYAGDPEQGQALVEPLRHFGTPVGEFIGVQPYTAWQQAFDPLLTPGARNYWKSHNFISLSDGLFDEVVGAIATLPSDQCEIFFGAIGAATTRASVDSAAYPNRDTNYVMNVHCRWLDASDDDMCIAWARAFAKASAPYATGSVYVNFLTEDEHARIPSAYGVNYKRLAQVKREYDPANLFRSNMNVVPE